MATRSAAYTSGKDTPTGTPTEPPTLSFGGSVALPQQTAVVDPQGEQPQAPVQAQDPISTAIPSPFAAATTPQMAASPLSSSSSSRSLSALTSRLALPTAGATVTGLRSGKHGGRPSSKFGTVNYSIDEMKRLNEKVRAVIPIASEDWLHVAYQFNYMRPESIPYREVDSLKRKFKKMYCSRATVGGKLPDYVQDAKELRQLINQRSERAQVQLDHTNSDSQSELDGQDHHHQEREDGNQTQSQSGLMESDGTTAPAVLVGANDDASDGGVAVVTTTCEGGAVELPASGSGNGSGSGSGDEAREIALRLQHMEEEYYRAMAAKRPGNGILDTGSGGATGAGTALFPEPSEHTNTTATTGIINLLKHSIERKRHTMEEQMLSESERVRKERKKRKMEQVLYNIHREQELLSGGGASSNGDGAVAAASAFGQESGATGSGSGTGSGGWNGSGSGSRLLSACSPGGRSTAWSSGHEPAPPSSSFSLSSSSSSPSSSLGVMEVVLQFMVAQQQDTARRVQQDEARRRKEKDEREIRRRAKDTQRRKETHEMMLVMKALLQENFPEQLSHHLMPPPLPPPGTSNLSLSLRQIDEATQDGTTDGTADGATEMSVEQEALL